MRNVNMLAACFLVSGILLALSRTSDFAYSRCVLENEYNCNEDGDVQCDYPTCGFSPGAACDMIRTGIDREYKSWDVVTTPQNLDGREDDFNGTDFVCGTEQVCRAGEEGEDTLQNCNSTSEFGPWNVRIASATQLCLGRPVIAMDDGEETGNEEGNNENGDEDSGDNAGGDNESGDENDDGTGNDDPDAD